MKCDCGGTIIVSRTKHKGTPFGKCEACHRWFQYEVPTKKRLGFVKRCVFAYKRWWNGK